MGGIGSGSWSRWDKKTTTEGSLRVDIRYLKKLGALWPGKSGTLSWSCGGEKTGSIGYRVEFDHLVLNYRAKIDGNWQSIEEPVQLDRTPCNYGGERTWLLCPRCGRRVAVLFGGTMFRCRHCRDLTYGSQQEGRIDRMMRKSRKIRDRLGVSSDLTEPVWQKPKHMCTRQPLIVL